MVAGFAYRVALVVALLAGLLIPTFAEDRFALVVGIDTYEELPRLQKARADAEAIGSSLRGLGFSVDLLLDPGRRGFNRAISTFLNKVTPGATVYIHYSGHGVEVDNDTFLLAADMPVPRAGDKEFVKTEGVRLSSLLQSLKGTPAAARLLSIDACRDNPFAAGGTRSIGGERGLAILPAPQGSLVMYSAAQGQTALDRLGASDAEKTSVYTRVLLQYLGQPGLSMTDVAQEVRRKVQNLALTVGHDQRPAYYDELSDRLFLAGPAGGPKPVAPPAILPPVPSVVPPPPPPHPDRDVWVSVRDTTSPAVLRAFLEEFPTGAYSGLARARLSELEQPKPIPPPPVVALPRPAAPPLVAALPKPAAPPPIVASPPVGGGNWLVILGSYPLGDKRKADQRLMSARGSAIAARLVSTSGFSNLAPGLWAVVVGPTSRGNAERELGRARGVAPDAYLKQAN